MLNKIIKDPLLHFVILGAALFALNQLSGEEEQDNLIEVNANTVAQLINNWHQTHDETPNNKQLQQLIDDYIKQQVLYREAIAQGLDQNDPVITERLVQKLSDQIEGFTPATEPSEQQLKDFYQQHTELFKTDAQISFQQAFINPAKHDDIQATAQSWLSQLRADDQLVLGDQRGFKNAFRDLTYARAVSLFGDAFATQLFNLTGDSWQGPVQSQNGLHLVRIVNKTDSLLPAFEQIRDAVAIAYQNQLRRQAIDDYYKSLKSEFVIKRNDLTATGAAQ
ncbi:peptidyl-prolyl cis-trans isomerase [Neptunicella marina]|uniref:peptidylprolyl isomerase n=1 Tax=Neptunicella marina TaxID=2125989 RepID=A0A8J6IS70_9ALTE|nr:peptidyl-prolyl cis-trans isomerase [Neptunicella marina]MBC3764805.1 peptidyl-prolyl cis-trans isomerase [Neptunicella marina]